MPERQDLSAEELYAKFSAFPPEQHVQTICELGTDIQHCRYLAMVPDRQGAPECAKASNLRQVLNQRVSDADMVAQGDNCPGTLGFVIENQELLMGNKVIHHEAGEDTPLVFDGIRTNKGFIEVGGFMMNEDFVQIGITPDGITFNAPYIGYAKVLFERVEQPQAASQG